MFIVSIVCLVFNLIQMKILHSGGDHMHGPAHGKCDHDHGAEGHDHAHHHHDHEVDSDEEPIHSPGNDHHDHCSHDHPHEHEKKENGVAKIEEAMMTMSDVILTETNQDLSMPYHETNDRNINRSTMDISLRAS